MSCPFRNGCRYAEACKDHKWFCVWALVHNPVYDKGGDIVATAVTNLDIHDIARMARTYGICRYFMITPLETQQEMAGRVIRHWTEGGGATYNPKRKEALSIVSVVPDLDAVEKYIEAECGMSPVIVATTARTVEQGAIGYSELREKISSDKPFLDPFRDGMGDGRKVFAEGALQAEADNGAG